MGHIHHFLHLNQIPRGKGNSVDKRGLTLSKICTKRVLFIVVHFTFITRVSNSCTICVNLFGCFVVVVVVVVVVVEIVG